METASERKIGPFVSGNSGRDQLEEKNGTHYIVLTIRTSEQNSSLCLGYYTPTDSWRANIWECFPKELHATKQILDT